MSGFSFWENFAIGILSGLLRSSVGNPITTALLKAKPILLEIRNDINALFPGE